MLLSRKTVTISVAILIFVEAISISKPNPDKASIVPDIAHITKISNIMQWERVMPYGHGCGNGTLQAQDFIPFQNQSFVYWSDKSIEIWPLNHSIWSIYQCDFTHNNVTIYSTQDNGSGRIIYANGTANYELNYTFKTLHFNFGELPLFVPTNRTDYS